MSLLRRVGLEFLKDELAQELSFGQQKLLEFAAVLMSEPEIVLLDEPAGGVNPTMIRFIMDLIRDLNEAKGVTFLVVEHNMNVVMSVSDRITVMHLGAILAEGTPEEIASNENVQTAYLGQLYDVADKVSE